ncbi:MAG: hypothetical protein WKG07_35980 [Hymenobacter sp.]
MLLVPTVAGVERGDQGQDARGLDLGTDQLRLELAALELVGRELRRDCMDARSRSVRFGSASRPTTQTSQAAV